MGVAFDKWLARPTTLRFLRDVLGETTSSYTAGRSCAYRRRYASGAFTSLLPSEHSSEKESRYNRTRDEDVGSNMRRVQRPRADKVKQRMNLQSDGLNLSKRYDTNSWTEQYESLKREADVDKPKRRLIDDLRTDEDKTQLWLMVLAFRQRIDGVDGVRAVWNGMIQRKYAIPTIGHEADILWQAFVSAAVTSVAKEREADVSWLTEIIRYAQLLRKQSGKSYGDLYRLIVMQLLRSSRPGYTLSFSDQLHEANLVPSNALRDVALDLIVTHVQRSFPLAYLYFEKMYLRSQDRDLYDSCITQALATLSDTEVLRWHNLFIANGDHPSEAMKSRPDVQFILDSADHGSHEIQRSRPVLDNPSHMPLTRENMSRLVGEIHGIKPRGVSDSFVARMFATKPFPTDLVINGLHFLGVDVIGPLALREMAARLGTMSDMKDAMAKLRSKGIGLSNDVFCRLVRKLIRDKEAGRSEAIDLYTTLLARDQHPEDYDNTSTQSALLLSFVEQDNLLEARLTFEALSLAGQTVTSAAWNKYVQLLLRRDLVQQACDHISEMHSQGVEPTEDTVAELAKHAMPKRNPSKAPRTDLKDTRIPGKVLTFLTRIWISAEERGASINPAAWTELIKQRGMLGHFNEVRKLILWLAARFKAARELERQDPRDATSIYWQYVGQARSQLADPSHPGAWRHSSRYLAIFDRRMQVAIFNWGFRAASKTTPWTSGIELLVQLEQYGIQANTFVMRRALKTRMWSLFGPGVSLRPRNEIERSRNELSLAQYVRHAVEIWDRRTKAASPRVDGVWQGGLLPGLDDDMLNDTDPYSQARLMLFLFGRYRRAFASADDRYWDVGSWVQELAASGKLVDRRSLRERRQAFERGRFLRHGMVRRRGLPPLYGKEAQDALPSEPRP